MTRTDADCRWARDRVEAFVDGDLGGGERAAFEAHVGGCPGCREELSRARSIVSGLRALPALECPDRVVDEAARRAGAGATGRTGPIGRLLERLGALRPAALPVRLPRPATAAMLVVIVAATVFVLSRHEQSPFSRTGGGPRVAETPSEKDVELAKLDVMLAFAYIGKYSRLTGEIIKQDVIEERVLKPVGEAIVEVPARVEKTGEKEAP